MGLRIKGFALITRSSRGTDVNALAWGLDPRTTYGAHLHNAPCSDPNPGGGHYMDDPAGPPMPPNELWLSSSGDPMAGITSNAIGIAFGRGSADWVARPDAQAVVIHAIPPGGTPAGGAEDRLRGPALAPGCRRGGASTRGARPAVAAVLTVRR